MLGRPGTFRPRAGRALQPHAERDRVRHGQRDQHLLEHQTANGDAWMKRMFALMNAALPGRLHVNGVDHWPWFGDTTFSPQALVADQRMPGDALLSLLDWRGEVWRSHGSAEREAAGRDGGADSVVCRHAAEAGVGRRIQHLHQGTARRPAGGVAGEGGARGDRAGRELVQLLG